MRGSPRVHPLSWAAVRGGTSAPAGPERSTDPGRGMVGARAARRRTRGSRARSLPAEGQRLDRATLGVRHRVELLLRAPAGQVPRVGASSRLVY